MNARGLATILVAVAAMAQQYPPQQYPPQQYPQQQPYPQQQQPQQGIPPDEDTGDSPDHAVARISFMNGNVSVRRGDSGDLVAAIVNAPLVVSDRVVTAEGSRAEVQFDSANMVRLAPATEIRFGDLQYHRYQIQIAVGTAVFRVLRDTDAQVEISTPSISARPLRKGVYRVTVQPDGNTEITVRSGEAEVFSPRGTEQVRAGQTLLARGNPSDPEFQIAAAYPEDEFDRWCGNRDRELERSTSYRYVSPDITGAEDLDNYGRWTNDGSYGNVWVPNVDPGWAPYRAGHWAWLDYYGWTWVSDDPWGWAPYHYGRWYQGSLGWCWWPGPAYPRHYWRPALVGFFGWGSGIGVGFGFGNVGWVPLAPYERFHPWYGRGYSGGFRNNVTIVNNTNVRSVYRNAQFANGITSVRSSDFGRGRISSNNFVRANAGDLSRAGMVRGQLPMGPTAESRRFTNRPASLQGMPRTNDNTRFFSSRQGGSVPQAQPRDAGGANNGWRRFDPANRGWQAVQGQAVQGQGSVTRQNSPSAAPQPQRNAMPQDNGVRNNNNNGWRRFDPGVQNQPQRGVDRQSQQPRYSAPVQQQPQPQAQPQAQPRNFDRGGNDRQQQPRSFDRPEPRTYSPPPQQQPRNFDNRPQQQYRQPQPQPQQQSQPRYSQPQQVHINPPIVQNRGGGGGGGNNSRANDRGGDRGGDRGRRR